MNYTRTRIDNDKRKNKPSVVFPIINTVLSAILITFVIILFVLSRGTFGVGLFIFCLIILVMFPIASWLNSYVLKKMNLRKINNYEKETEMLIKYVRRYESYRAYELGKDIKAKFEIKETDQINSVAPKFNVETCNFGTPQNINNLMTFGVSFAGVEINRETKQIVGVAGMLPRSVWYPKHLKTPEYKKAKIKIEFSGRPLDQKVVIHALKRSDIYYDNKTGWLCCGDRKTTILDEAYEVSKDVLVVIRDNAELLSIWVKIGPGLLVK